MKRRVIITGLAEADALSNHQWWGENRSFEQANRWLEGLYATMLGLATTAGSQTLATEIVLRKAGIRQATFGLGSRPSHRIMYGIEGEQVIIYRVRAFKQDDMNLGDLG